MANESWRINGIEFEMGEIRGEKLVESREFGVFFFSPRSFARCDELVQLVEGGYLDRYTPAWLSAPCFSLRLSLNSTGEFAHDGSEPAACHVCGVSFNWSNDGDQLVETWPGRGPRYASGGEPPEYEAACPACVDGEGAN